MLTLTNAHGTWEAALEAATAEARRTGVRQWVRKSHWLDYWIVSPVNTP